MEIRVLDHQAVRNILPDRQQDSHKGTYGKILLLCGSKGYTGAAALSAMGALRAGAGLVFLAVPECIYEIEAIKLNEPVVQALPSLGNTYAPAAAEAVIPMLEGKDAVLIGPGIGRTPGALAMVKSVLTHFTGPVVLDADGISLLATHKDILRSRTAPTILTPHAGEFQRIGGDCTHDRIGAAVKLAKELGAVILLKGSGTIITDGVSTYRNPTGNPGMAVGGSGDVLSGIITAFLGQGIAPLEAAACGAWVHGAAGDICAKEIGQYGMIPSDTLNVLPRLLK